MSAFADEPADDEIPATFLQALVTARADDDETLRSLASWWLEESRSRLCSALWDRRAGRDSAVEAVVGRIGVRSLGRGEWSVVHTEDRFDLLIASLGERRGDAFWRIVTDPEDLAAGDVATAHLNVTAEPDSHPWVSFTAAVTYRAEDDGAVPAVSQRVLTEFVADFAEFGSATFANIATDNDGGRTALEMLLPRQRGVGMAESPVRLRGYSWVTVIPPAVVERLGGASGLEATGAFAEVRLLRYGGVMLRATELLEQYDDEAMTRVFHALAPALPPGRPRELPPFAGPPVARLVYEDAAGGQS